MLKHRKAFGLKSSAKQASQAAIVHATAGQGNLINACL